MANADLLANELLWSSFAKARLLCAPRAAQVTGTQLQYDFLQDVQFDKKRQQFVAVFLNKDPAVWAWSNHARSLDSAVCTFSVHDLLQAFSGPRLHLDKTGQWTLSNEFPATVSHAALFKCNLSIKVHVSLPIIIKFAVYSEI